MNLFSDEPSLQKLLSDGKVSILDKEVWYDESDEEVDSNNIVARIKGI